MLASLVDPLVDLVLPRRCVGCREPGSAWCAACRAGLAVRATALPTEQGPGLEVVAAAEYAGPARQAVLAYKERGRRDLAAPLARLLASALRTLLAACGLRPAEVMLVGVPSTRAAAARRGGDHVARLAVRAGRIAGLRVAPGVLRVSGGVRDSAGLSVTERSRNLRGAMRAAPNRTGARVRSRQVIVVDDIVTSGATLLEARRALHVAGWSVSGAAACAATLLTAGGEGVNWHRYVSDRPLAPPSRRV